MTIGEKNHWNKSKWNKSDTQARGSVFKPVENRNGNKKFPKSVLYFNSPNRNGLLHPTQKPVQLFEYLIKTFSNENDLVVDLTMGSGTTMIACQNTKRNGIGIELDEHYFAIAKKRVEENKKELDAPTLFTGTD